MKRVVIWRQHSRIPDFFLHPVRRNAHRLRELGYDVRLITQATPKTMACDIFCVMSKTISGWWGDTERVADFLDEAKAYAAKIVLMDDADSTATCHFEILPHVDLYLKKQLYTDLSLYTRPFYGDRLFTDYYHREFGIADCKEFCSTPLDISQAHKVHLSWHIGLGDIAGDILPKGVKWLRARLSANYPSQFTPSRKERPIDVMFRGSRHYARPTVSFQRERIGEILDGLTDMYVATRGKVSVRRYIQESENAKMVVSPFGWGEIGVRDFEAWLYGAALLKPDMSHMATWPNCFIPGETYHSLAWDCSNVESSIRDLAGDYKQRLQLAERGQDAYRKMVSEEGMEQFCSWFVQQIER